MLIFFRMESTVIQRIVRFINYKNISQRQFEIKCGLSNGYINNIRVSIQPDKIQKISLCYPELNTGWLLTGEGEMLNINITSEPTPRYGIDYKEKYYELLEKNLTTHVARHTYATYLLNRNIPIETVSRCLGHSNIKMTQSYARMLGRKVISDMQVLLK